MVGFGSSLRMSRRRGWEDAYLDYQSLRLLLTQIEAVYEEEDWKRCGDSGDGRGTTGGGVVGFGGGGSFGDLYGGGDPHVVVVEGSTSYHPALGEEEEGEDDDDATLDDDDDDDVNGGWKQLAGNAWRMITGSKSCHHYNSSGTSGGRYYRRSSSRRYPHVTSSASHHHHHRRKRNKSKDSHHRAKLDRGGLRSPGVTDYRDELFLVSDEDVAYGYYDDDDGDDDIDDDEWEDEEDSIGEEDQRYYANEVGHYDGTNNLGSSNTPTIGSEWHQQKLTPGFGKLETDEDLGGGGGGGGNDQDQYRDYNSPPQVQDNNNNNINATNEDDAFPFSNSSKNRILLQNTPSQNCQSQSSPLSNADQKPSLKVQFSDSPGVLEAGYETFAQAAAARSGGFVSPGVGSPSEDDGFGGWLDFIPSLLHRKKEVAPPRPPELDPILNQREESSEQDALLDNSSIDYSPMRPMADNPVVTTEESPHRYTHFSERFLPALRHQRPSKSDNLAREELSLAPNNEAPSATTDRLEIKKRLFLPTPPVFEGTSALRNMLDPTIAMTPPLTPVTQNLREYRGSKNNNSHNNNRSFGGSFGVSLKMIPTESTKLLRPSSPNRSYYNKPSTSTTMAPHQQHEEEDDAGMSQFYSFQNASFQEEEEDNYHSSDASRGRYSGIIQQHNATEKGTAGTGGYDGEDGGEGEDEERGAGSNMISFYSGGKDGYFSIRSPTKVVSSRSRGGHHHQHHHGRQHFDKSHHHHPSSPSNKKSIGDAGGNFVLSLLFGRAHDSSGKEADDSQGRVTSRNHNHRGGGMVRSSSSNEHVIADHHHHHRRRRAATPRKKRAAAMVRRKRARVREQRRRRRRERVPEHLRVAHARAAAITERFRGLLRAEVEKVILFANSRLGELSNTIGSLRYSSYEETTTTHKDYPSLADGGMHHMSSSDSDGDSGLVSCASLSFSSDELPLKRIDGDLGHDRENRTFKSDSSKDETKKQIMLRDRLRISSPMFQKADFLGEDFSLLSAVDEADAYTAVGVELMHLLKYVCVNIIAVRKICKKHDRLCANRMLGGYYHSLAAEAKRSQNTKRGDQHRLFPLSETQPQFGGTLSNPSASQRRGYIYGIYDTKIQHVANSATMQTVSSSLAIALSDFEASQSRSTRLGLFGRSKSENSGVVGVRHEVPSPKHQTFTTSRLRDAVSYQISGQCFRGDDESTIASQDGCDDDNASISSNTSLTRLQFVVTSIFGLREAARFKSVPFEHYSSRLFMVSSGPNVTGDGLDGCSRQTLDFLCAYNPDAAYTLDMETIYTSLKIIGRKKDGLCGVMVASLSAAAKGYDRRAVAAAMSINPQATGEEDDTPISRNVENEYQNILRLNTISMMLFKANYYIIIPTAHMYSTFLGRRGTAALIIGIANVSSILSSVIHSSLMSKRNSFKRKHTGLSSFRLPLTICSAFALAGNMLYSYSLTKASLGIAFIGRFLVGFGSAEILNRQLLLSIYPPECINAEVATLAKMSMITTSIALFLGSLVDIKVKDGLPPVLASPLMSIMPSPTPAANITLVTVPASQPFLPPLSFDPLAPYIAPFGQHSLLSLESIGYVMSFAWLIHLLGMLFFFDPPKSKRRQERETVYPDAPNAHTTLEEDFDSDTETFDQEKIETNAFVSANTQEVSHGDGTFEKLQTMSRKTVKHQSQHTYRESIVDVRRIMFTNVAFPTTVAVLFIVKITTEVLLSSCGSITSRYFNWSGARSGLLMGCMASIRLPMNMYLATERDFTERRIMKVAIETGRSGFWLMLNYKSLFLFFTAIIKGGKKGSSSSYDYDGIFGATQYILSFAIVFSSMIALESSTLTLMSKAVAPRQMKKYSIFSVVTFVSGLGRLVGCSLIFATELSSWTFSNDIVNSLCLALIIGCTAGLYVVKKHYFFLIGG